ncbi:hypothetical protein D9613_000159 [Agrocybe pediades]|uniref:Uncharacterized protein n=1 Tax=Agrocybe pediades TaxID=84607 RepID=A0A8H4VS69_9AGAR|nr:hypothetical protein D9613_000159 [Agrocybe pediades]
MTNPTIPGASFRFLGVFHPNNASRANVIHPQSTAGDNAAVAIIQCGVHSLAMGKADVPQKTIFGPLGSISAVNCKSRLTPFLQLAAYLNPRTVQSRRLGWFKNTLSRIRRGIAMIIWHEREPAWLKDLVASRFKAYPPIMIWVTTATTYEPETASRAVLRQ